MFPFYLIAPTEPIIIVYHSWSYRKTENFVKELRPEKSQKSFWRKCVPNSNLKGTSGLGVMRIQFHRSQRFSGNPDEGLKYRCCCCLLLAVMSIMGSPGAQIQILLPPSLFPEPNCRLYIWFPPFINIFGSAVKNSQQTDKHSRAIIIVSIRKYTNQPKQLDLG